MQFASINDIVQAYIEGQQAVLDLFLEQVKTFSEMSQLHEMQIQKLEQDIAELSSHVVELEKRLGISSDNKD